MGKNPKWSEDEKRLLWQKFGSISNEQIQDQLLTATGRYRSEDAIQIKANKLGITKQMDGASTLRDAARHLGVNYATLHSMVEAGKLKTTRRGKFRWVNLDEMERLEALFPPIPERSMTKLQARKLLGYSETHFTRLLLAGAIRGVRRGDRWFVDADHINALAAEMKRKGQVRREWGSLPRLDAERAKMREYARTRRKESRAKARQEVWYTQLAAARVLGVGRDEMRRLLESGQVRGKQENDLWLAERGHVDELAATASAT